MQKTSYQAPELRDDNNNIIRPGAYGKNTAFCTPNNKGVLDYINNNLEYLHDTMVMAFDLSEIGLTTPCTTVDILKAMSNNTMAVINVETKSSNITDVPTSYGVLTIKKGNSIQRSDIEFKQSSSTGGVNRYYASYNSTNDTIAWYKYTAVVV